MTNLSEQQLEQLSAYLDGELPDHERIAVEQQLQENAVLAAELREMQGMLAMLRDVPAVQPPRTFTLDPATYGRQRRTGFGWMRWAGVLGALVLMLTVGLTLSQGGQSAENAPMAASLDDTTARQMPSPDMANSAAGSAAATAAPAPTTAAAMAAPAMDGAQAQPTAQPMGAAAPESPSDEAFKIGEATPSIGMNPYGIEPGTDFFRNQPIPGPYPAGTTVDLTTDSLELSQTDTLPPAAGSSFPAPPLQESGTSSPDTRELDSARLELNQPLPDPQAAATSGALADESPALWLLFLIAALIGIAAASVITRALRHVE